MPITVRATRSTPAWPEQQKVFEMASKGTLTRRQFLHSTTALAGAVALGSTLPMGAARAAGLAVGFIYVGPKDDYGYNQAHAEGAAAVKGIEGVTVIEEENVAETIDVLEDR